MGEQKDKCLEVFGVSKEAIETGLLFSKVSRKGLSTKRAIELKEKGTFSESELLRELD